MDRHGDIGARIERDGYALLPGIFSASTVADLIRELGQALAAPAGAAATLRSQEGVVYAARNLLQVWPRAADFWRGSELPAVLTVLLGSHFGLVRILYFDKPPEASWSLPWHKDLTIAVRDNRLPSARFRAPTRKAGIPHVEAPLKLLQAMLTARIHLDPAAEVNGPLEVAPGSHHAGKKLVLDAAGVTILAQPGDTLLMRPLVTHRSGRSHPDTTLQRRILHLEFAAHPHLEDGYRWHDFHPGAV
jgi:hypothetical protein